MKNIRNVTDERFIPNSSFSEEASVEHYLRYSSIQTIVKDKIVLDAACGEGYGTFMISSMAKKAYGIDISEEIVQFATEKYSSHNLEYKVASIEELPFDDSYFDIIVSFETIEHVDGQSQEKFLSEVKRTLKPDGILIISTPNRTVYTEKYSSLNHYHIKEFNFHEFDNFLKKQFANIKYYEQSFKYSAVIEPLDSSEFIYFKKVDLLNRNESFENSSKFFIAFCSNSIVQKKVDVTCISYDLNNNNRSVLDFLNEAYSVQLFWSQDRDFNEEKSLTKLIYKDEKYHEYEFEIENSKYIRLDPINIYSEVIISKIVVMDENRNVLVDSAIDRAILKTMEFYQCQYFINFDGNIHILSTSTDPQIVFRIKNNNFSQDKLIIQIGMKISLVCGSNDYYNKVINKDPQLENSIYRLSLFVDSFENSISKVADSLEIILKNNKEQDELLKRNDTNYSSLTGSIKALKDSVLVFKNEFKEEVDAISILRDQTKEDVKKTVSILKVETNLINENMLKLKDDFLINNTMLQNLIESSGQDRIEFTKIMSTFDYLEKSNIEFYNKFENEFYKKMEEHYKSWNEEFNVVIGDIRFLREVTEQSLWFKFRKLIKKVFMIGVK